MRADILIVGQGLAGTLLAWEFERAGIAFDLVDAGPEKAASRVAAGIVNPITGRRLVKSWRIDALLPAARETYRALETALGVPLWRELRIRRGLADERERRIAAEKQARGELAPYVRELPDTEGFWIEDAARVDVVALLDAARARWGAAGRLRADNAVELVRESANYDLTIDCRGVAGAREPGFAFVPWEFSKGEILAVEVTGLDPGVVLNQGPWVLPWGEGKAWVGATHEPNAGDDRTTTLAGRAQLEASAAKLLGRPFTVTGHFSGLRVNLPDKRPIAGRHPQNARMGLLNALGAKGVLWAPLLARQWVNHLTEGVAFEAEVAVERFARGQRA